MLEIFFDYSCPFCLKGHENLLSLRDAFPALTIEWRPCEAHPRPERYGKHSDLCIRAMFFARDKGIDLWVFHQRMYDLAVGSKVDIENPAVIADAFSDMLNSTELRAALDNGDYVDALAKSNHYAYQECGVWAVPTYKIGEKMLHSVENVGVSREDLATLLRGISG